MNDGMVELTKEELCHRVVMAEKCVVENDMERLDHLRMIDLLRKKVGQLIIDIDLKDEEIDRLACE